MTPDQLRASVLRIRKAALSPMTYAERVEQLIDEGLDRDDAQSVADAEHKGGRAFAFNPDFPNDPSSA